MSDDGPITHTVFGETVSVCQACGMAVFGEHRFCGECEAEDSSTDDDTWRRNDDHYWYNKGYSLGAVETKRDVVALRLLGAWTLFGAVMWDPLTAGVFLALYTGFTALNWQDWKAKAAEHRDRYDPGPEWEGMRRDPDDA